MQSKPRSAVLITKNHQILLIERRKAGQPAYYVLPGGGIEAGETPQQAAIREMKEELGVNIAIVRADQDSAADRETWIVRASLKGDAQPMWQEHHKQSPDNQYRAIWIPFQELSQHTIFPSSITTLNLK